MLESLHSAPFVLAHALMTDIVINRRAMETY
jgi:hypothetical protein